MWRVNACTQHGIVQHNRGLCACYHKHTAGIGTPVFRNMLKCLSGYCLWQLSVQASIGVRPEGNGLVEICAPLFNRTLAGMQLLLVMVEELCSSAGSMNISVRNVNNTYVCT